MRDLLMKGGYDKIVYLDNCKNLIETIQIFYKQLLTDFQFDEDDKFKHVHIHFSGKTILFKICPR